MSKKIFNTQNFGSYNYLTQLIEIDTELFARTTEQVIEIINTKESKKLEGKDLELYKTYVHEMTHFLDSTTTLWGLQYSIRLYQWFKCQNNRTLEVLALNDAEITLHNLYDIEVAENVRFSKIKYSLEYHEQFGVFIKIHYLDDFDNTIRSHPLSMLALLEGHAYAKELIISIKKYELDDNLVELARLRKTSKDNMLKLSSCEYTTFLALATQMMPNMSDEIRLNLLCNIFEFCLDIPMIYLAQTPDYLFDMAFEGCKKEYISQLKMEFSGNQNRHILALLVLFEILNKIHNNYVVIDDNFMNNIENLILSIFNTDNKSVEDLLESIQTCWQLELGASIDILEGVNSKLPLSMAQQRVNLGWGYKNYTEYNLPDICVNDVDKASFNQRLDLDIDEHFCEIYDKCKSLESAISLYGIKKNHPSPNFSHGFLEYMKQNPGSGVYYYHE